MNKIIKSVFLVGLTSLVLFGCSNEKEKEAEKAPVAGTEIQGIDFEKVYNMKDDEVLFSVQGKDITVKEVKEKVFQQGLVNVINQFVDNAMLVEEYKITDQDVENEIKKRKEALGESAVGVTFDKESIRYNLAYDKAINANVKFTDEDLKTIYDKYFAANETRTFEQMKEELKKQAPHILGGEKIYQIQQELRKKADVTFKETSLENEFKQMYAPEEAPKK